MASPVRAYPAPRRTPGREQSRSGGDGFRGRRDGRTARRRVARGRRRRQQPVVSRFYAGSRHPDGDIADRRAPVGRARLSSDRQLHAPGPVFCAGVRTGGHRRRARDRRVRADEDRHRPGVSPPDRVVFRGHHIWRARYPDVSRAAVYDRGNRPPAPDHVHVDPRSRQQRVPQLHTDVRPLRRAGTRCRRLRIRERNLDVDCHVRPRRLHCPESALPAARDLHEARAAAPRNIA